MEQIKINDGRKRYLITNMDGDEIGVISINPKDFNFINRADVAENAINAKVKEASNAAKTIKESKSDKDLEEILTEIDESIKKQLDFLFDYDVSAQVFGNVHCLSLEDGETFIERFMAGVLPVIKKEYEAEKEASKKRMNKYQPMDHLEKQ